MTWEPGKPHTMPNPSRCPSCGAEGEFQELSDRPTWQPVSFKHEGEWSGLIPIDYGEFDYGDEVRVTGYRCTGCGSEWPTVEVLAHDQRLVQAFQDWEDHHRESFDVTDAEDEVACVMHEAAADAWRQGLAILRGNGEA